MTPKDVFSRRNFLAASSGALSAGGLSAQGAKDGGAAAASSLALHGGPKAVQDPQPKRVRWGEPEREQLDTVVKQNSLFYWGSPQKRAPQTALLIERFRKTYPLKYVQT